MGTRVSEIVRLPSRGIVAYVTHVTATSTLNGAEWDDEAIELEKAFKDGKPIPVDDYGLLCEVVDEMRWNSF